MINHFAAGRTFALVAGVAVAATFCPHTGFASGFFLKEQSAIDQGAAYAGAAARADDPSTLFYNPAGMVNLPGYQVSIDAAVIIPSSTLESGSGSTNTPFGAIPFSGTAGKNAAASVVLPSFYATAQLAPDWHVGLAFTSPFGLSTKYDADSVARYYALTTSLATYNFTPSIAWQVLPKLTVAAGLQVQIANANLSNAVDFGSIGAGLRIPGFAPGHNDGIASLKGNDTAVGWQAGLLYQPLDGTRVGLDYRSAIFYQLTGSVNFQNVPLPLSQVGAFTGGPASAKLVTPATLSLGLAQDIGQFTVLAGFDYTFWSQFRSLFITWPTGTSLTEENWHDTYMLSLGGDWRVNEQWTLRAGLAYDQTPTSDSTRTPRIPDANRYWVSIGATWRPVPRFALSVAYSHIFGSDSSVNQVDAGPGTPNYLRGNLTATYHNHIDIVSLGGTLTF